MHQYCVFYENTFYLSAHLLVTLKSLVKIGENTQSAEKNYRL